MRARQTCDEPASGGVPVVDRVVGVLGGEHDLGSSMLRVYPSTTASPTRTTTAAVTATRGGCRRPVSAVRWQVGSQGLTGPLRRMDLIAPGEGGGDDVEELAQVEWFGEVGECAFLAELSHAAG